MNSLFKVSACNHAGMIMMTVLANAKGEYLSLQEIADKMHLSQGFLEEIATKLKRNGLIKGRQGAKGGYSLAKPANKITAEDILVALEGPVGLPGCSGYCPVSSGCSSKTLWSFLYKDLLKSLKSTKLSDI